MVGANHPGANRLLLLLLCFLVTTETVEANPPSAPGAERTLGGHTFQPSLYVNDPWLDTAFNTYTGGGMASVDRSFPSRDGDEVFMFEGELYYVALGIGFQQRVDDARAVGLSLTGNVRTGTDTFVLIAEGANVDRALRLWFKQRAWRRERSQLTVGLDWSYAKTFVFTPEKFARALINGEDLNTAPLISSIKSWTASVTLDYAYSFSPTYAMRASGYTGLYEVPFARSVSRAAHRLGLMFEWDLKHKRDLPLGLTVGYTYGLPRNDPPTGLAGALLGIWYTGTEATAIGAELGFMSTPSSQEQQRVGLNYLVFTVRHDF